MTFCITKQSAEKLKRAFKDKKIDPFKLSEMDSEGRRAVMAEYVGERNAKQVNALFESKLLLKNQVTGFKTWAKSITGIKPKVRQDIFARIERLDKALSAKEVDTFLEDMIQKRLNMEVTEEETSKIFELSRLMDEKKKQITDNMPLRSKERIEYGTVNALMKDYVAKVKYDAKKLVFREQPVRYFADIALNTIPNTSQSIMTAFDNSLWLRQVIGAATTPRYTKIWIKNFLKSWVDIGKQLTAQGSWLGPGDDAVITAIKADIFSRPNALNGKYLADSNQYGLGVTSEEVFQSEFPAKIPILGRLFKASQVAFNGGALRMRADIADLEIQAAETLGINVLDKDNAKAIGSLVTSITGRGSVGGSEGLLRKVFWAPRMYVGQLNQLTAHVFDPKANTYTKKQAAKNLVSGLGVYTLIFSLAKMLDKDSVDTKENLGKIKVWGKWVDITGGRGAYARLVMKMTDKIVSYMQGEQPKYGESSAMDDLLNFAQGKFSPTASLIRDVLKGSLYGGAPITTENLAKTRLTPINYQTWEDLSKDPTASNIFGLMLLEFNGANVSSWLAENEKTEIIPTGEEISEDNFINMVSIYAEALGKDPETALKRIFTNQKILEVRNGTIIVERMELTKSQEYKKKYGADTKEMKLDHTIPLQLGGGNDASNLKIVSTGDWRSYTPVENALGKALKDKKISKKEAQDLILKFKSIKDSKKRKKYGDELINKYK